jgi:hypothetical protein
MLLHIGENHYLDSETLIMVLNQRCVDPKTSKTRLIPKGGKRVSISNNPVKSWVVQEDNTVLESPIDSQTLYKRDKVLIFLEREAQIDTIEEEN